ncbi:MAG TPA: helix-turn-helix domain-containing protein [Solirubrobacteraceae bacterium]|jgi:excisionase family DNA binding protein|nr:helix-turn-helix domain-containing protein [Solirubrobacteraceae bacterium]
MRSDDSTALYVRLPSEQAQRLDRAAHATGLAKRELINGLVRRYVDPDSPRSLEALSRLGGGPARRRLGVPVGDGAMPVGHIAFRAPEAQVLDLDQAAELLQVEPELVESLAREDALPARRLGEHWRFSRHALLDWLAGERPRSG